MRCTFMVERRRILGRLFRRVCRAEAICIVRVWGNPPLFDRAPDFQAPRCENHRQLDTERLLGDRVTEEFLRVGGGQASLFT